MAPYAALTTRFFDACLGAVTAEIKVLEREGS